MFKSNNDENHILFNILTGNCVKINPELTQMIKDNTPDLITGDDKELFIKVGVLIPSKIDENKIYSYMNTKERHNTSHFGATVLLTEACNLRCIYCFQGYETLSQWIKIRLVVV